MKEVEVKAKIRNPALVLGNIKKLRCTLSPEMIQKDIIFLHNSMEFSEIKKGDVVLRIRDSDGKFTMTLKKQLENELDNIEKEIIIDNPKQGEDILKHMNFHEVIRINKTRRQCTFNDVSVCIDEVDGLGSFIEVEKITDADSKNVQEELFTFLENLGIQKSDRVFQGYDTLLFNKSKS